METGDSNYGSDRYGLVWGYVLGAGREAEPIDSEGVWLHFSLANAACRSWLRTNLELPDAFHDELREGTGSTSPSMPRTCPRSRSAFSRRS
jgi:zinc transporter